MRKWAELKKNYCLIHAILSFTLNCKCIKLDKQQKYTTKYKTNTFVFFDKMYVIHVQVFLIFYL